MEVKKEELPFDKMSEAVKAHAEAISQTNREVELELYALYKQATEGDLTATDPGAKDVDAHSKWQAWKNRTGMSKEEAMKAYNELAKKVLPKSVFS